MVKTRKAATVVGLSHVVSIPLTGGVPIDMENIFSLSTPLVGDPLKTTSSHNSSMTVALLFPDTFSRGIGVAILTVTNSGVAPVDDTLPDMKLGKLSFVFAPPLCRRRLAILGALRRRLVTLLVVLRRLVPLVFLRNRFLLPRGRNLPLASLGSCLANRRPLATLFADFFFLRALGISL